MRRMEENSILKRVNQSIIYYEKVKNRSLIQKIINIRKIKILSKNINQANAFDRDKIH